MPRASDGTVTLVSGATAVSGQTISSVDHNTNMADIASMLQDSLSRSGKGGMTAPMEFANGSSANPSITFALDKNTGLYRVFASALGITGNGTLMALFDGGTNVITFYSTDVQVNGNLVVVGSLSLANNSISRSALPAVFPGGSSHISVSCGDFSTTSLTLADVTNLSVPVSTSSTGNPVQILIKADGGANVSYMGVETGLTQATAAYAIVRTVGGVDTTIAKVGATAAANSFSYWPGYSFLDTSASASQNYTYRLQAAGPLCTNVIKFMKMVAYEI